jgi:putative flippase GtrA
VASRTLLALRSLWELAVRYALKFGVVGLLGYVVDAGIFNLLRLGVFGEGHALQGPIGAKIVSSAVAILVTWFGNRYWTFREHRRENFLLELVEFTAIAVAGLGISLAFLYVSHFVLGFDNLVADNISANVVGLFFATTFRFLMYRYWVYGHHRADGLAARRRRASEQQDVAESAEGATQL